MHMAHRGAYLLGIPILLNLVLFYIHFYVLVRAGPGNAFMSLDFQETLQVLLLNNFLKGRNRHLKATII